MAEDEPEFKQLHVDGSGSESFSHVHTEFKNGWKHLFVGEGGEGEEEERPPECPDFTQQNCFSQYPQAQCQQFCTGSICATMPPLGCPSTVYKGCSPGMGQCWYNRTGTSCVENMGLYDCWCYYAYAGNNCH